VIDDWQVHVYPTRSYPLFGIFSSEHFPLHRRELRMLAKEALDPAQVTGSRRQVVIEADDDLARGPSNGEVLDAAFAGRRIVDVTTHGHISRQRRWLRRAVVGDQNFVFAGDNLGRKTV
jgi:hypothetical protein